MGNLHLNLNLWSLLDNHIVRLQRVQSEQQNMTDSEGVIYLPVGI